MCIKYNAIVTIDKFNVIKYNAITNSMCIKYNAIVTIDKFNIEIEYIYIYSLSLFNSIIHYHYSIALFTIIIHYHNAISLFNK